MRGYQTWAGAAAVALALAATGCTGIDGAGEPCGEVTCRVVATCETISDVDRCVCPQGFAGDGTDDGTGCYESCETSTTCDALATCTEDQTHGGSVSCACDLGFSGTGLAGGTGCAADVVGALSAQDPGVYADGSLAPSCLAYLAPADPAAYAAATLDGYYTVDPAGDGNAFDVYCDMSTDGGGFTRVVSWDRENGGDDLASFKTELTQDFNNMGTLIDATSSIQWYETNFTSDAMAFHRDVLVPNGGDVLLDVKYVGYSLEGSGTWLYAVANGTEENLRCYDDIAGFGTLDYDANEKALVPSDYTCAEDSATGYDPTWDEVAQIQLGGEISRFALTSLHNDNGAGGDQSDLYRLALYVR